MELALKKNEDYEVSFIDFYVAVPTTSMFTLYNLLAIIQTNHQADLSYRFWHRKVKHRLVNGGRATCGRDVVKPTRIEEDPESISDLLAVRREERV